MDIGVIIALCVASFLTLVSGVAAGLFGGMWWQARQTAQVWEKAYTHVREQLPAIKHDTYNTGRLPPVPSLNYDPPPTQPAPRTELSAKERVQVQADVRPPPPVPSTAARSFGSATATGAGDFELEDDPLGPQIRK